MSARTVVTVAAVITALGVGVVLGSAAPRPAHEAPVTEQATPGLPEPWVDALAAQGVGGRLEDLRVVVITDAEAPDSLATAVTDALAASGASVVGGATLLPDWYLPGKATFRAELLQQFEASLPDFDADGDGGAPLDAAIVRAMIAPEDDATGEALRRSLEGAALVSEVRAPGEGVDAVVIVAGDDADAAAQAALAGRAWKRADGTAPATVVVMGEPWSQDRLDEALRAGSLGSEALGDGASAAVTLVGNMPPGERPSVVVAGPSLMFAPQLVGAVVEQRGGASGTYGAYDGLPVLPSS